MQRSFQEAGADEFKQRHPVIITLSARSWVEAGGGGGGKQKAHSPELDPRHTPGPGILKGDCTELPPCAAVLLLIID